MALPTSEGSTDTQIRRVQKGRLSPEGSRVPLETWLAMGRVPSQRSEYLMPVAWLFRLAIPLCSLRIWGIFSTER